MRQIQPLCDVPVREPLGGELGDLKLLGGQLVAGGEVAPTARFPGRPELPAGLVAPGGAAHGLEGVAGVPQRRTRVGDPALTPQPLAVGQQQPGALKGPVREVGAERLVEAARGFLRAPGLLTWRESRCDVPA